jgi:nuclear RNA export factor
MPMLSVSSRNTSNMARSKVAGPSRGGIRKRGAPTRTDRDGDLDMGAATQRGRGGKRARGHGPSRDLASRMELDRDRIHKAISSGDATSQANIRQGVTKARTEEFSITGWKESKAASNPDGGIRSLVDWLEKKLFSTKHGRKNIIKVCSTSALAVTDAVSAQSRIFSGCTGDFKTDILNDDRDFSGFFLTSIIR